jgi:hypothetical protein
MRLEFDLGFYRELMGFFRRHRKLSMLDIRDTFYSRILLGMIRKATNLMKMMRIPRRMLRPLKRIHFLGLRLRVGLTLFLIYILLFTDLAFFFLDLLCPLKHPSELPNHPSMSQPYTSQALEQMTQAVDFKLRQERALLWRARNLHRQFLGDGGWVPCGATETPDDRWIFDPRIVSNDPSISAGQQGPSGFGTPSATEPRVPQDVAHEVPSQTNMQSETQRVEPTNDTEMAEVLTTGVEATDSDPQLKSEETDATVKDLPPHNEVLRENDQETKAATYNEQHNMDPSKDGEPEIGDDTEDLEMHDGSSPEPPRRMTTRAQANAVNPDGSPLSSADTASTLPTPHPLFLIPDNVRPDANFGLPPAEAEETRRLLWSYIQKQEETVRGFEHMLNSLLKSCRMKSDVLEWCKAEGHVGEMSDGEDWYDREKWGLADGEDLKKGTDEDEIETVDESRTQAKRGRGRRQ